MQSIRYQIGAKATMMPKRCFLPSRRFPEFLRFLEAKIIFFEAYMQQFLPSFYFLFSFFKLGFKIICKYILFYL